MIATIKKNVIAYKQPGISIIEYYEHYANKLANHMKERLLTIHPYISIRYQRYTQVHIFQSTPTEEDRVNSVKSEHP